MLKKRIGIIGAGNMGEALIKGLLKSRLVSQRNIVASDASQQRRDYIKRLYKIKTFCDNTSMARLADILIIAVKPQDMASVLDEIRGSLSSGKLVISIAAGITTRFIEERLGGKNPVVRVMPNSPALIGCGISAITKGGYATKRDLEITEMIFGAVGEVVRIKDEDLMDAVTALSGSGPAYFFYLVEAFLVVGVKLGLNWQTILKLASQTALGSAKLLMETKLMPQILRERVTSKGGTTEAALEVFQRKHLDKIIEKAVFAAAKRSRKLRGGK